MTAIHIEIYADTQINLLHIHHIFFNKLVNVGGNPVKIMSFHRYFFFKVVCDNVYRFKNQNLKYECTQMFNYLLTLYKPINPELFSVFENLID